MSSIHELTASGRTPSTFAAVQEPTLTESLRAKKALYKQQLADINNALSALEAMPEVEKVLNLINRTMRY